MCLFKTLKKVKKHLTKVESACIIQIDMRIVLEQFNLRSECAIKGVSPRNSHTNYTWTLVGDKKV